MNQQNEEKKENQPIEEVHNEVIKFLPKGRHTWRQQGCYLVCKTCDLQHAVYIGMDKVMVGEEEDGTPIIKKRV